MSEQETPQEQKDKIAEQKPKKTGQADNPMSGNTASDSTTINPKAEQPIDPKMPDMPPA